jgi:protein-tyrosine phosphatase
MLDSLFRKNDLGGRIATSKHQILVDVHAHVLPNLDDGAESIEQCMLLMQALKKLGYCKIIATPHVMSGYYNNTPEKIYETLSMVRDALDEYQIQIEIEAAAEYYLDDDLLHQIECGNQLLTLDSEKRYLLFETSFVGKTSYLLDAVLKMKKGGYTPVLAHPERYLYLQKDAESLLRLVNSGVLFQLNINSLTGYYSKQAQELAEMLINRKMVAFVGTDCHSEAQLENLKTARQLPHYQVLMKQNLLNNMLLKTEGVLV